MQYEIDDIIDSAVSVQLLRDLGLVLHSRLCPTREETLVVDDTDEITVHIASRERVEQGLLSLGRKDDNVRQVLESLGTRWRETDCSGDLDISDIDCWGAGEQHIALHNVCRLARIVSDRVDFALNDETTPQCTSQPKNPSTIN